MKFLIHKTGVPSALYRVEFQHVNRATAYGRKKLHYVKGIRGMTTCAVVSGDIVSIKTIFCSDSDNFWKEAGRLKSLTKALEQCPKFPREHIAMVLEMYHKRHAEPSYVPPFLRGNVVSVPEGDSQRNTS